MVALVEPNALLTISTLLVILSINKDSVDLNSSSVGTYKGGKFLRGRKYSFSPHVKESKKHSDKVNTSANMKKLANKGNPNLMMLNVNGDGLNVAYEDLMHYNNVNKMGIMKPSNGYTKQSGVSYQPQPKKKKSNSAQPSPHRNAMKASKNTSHPNAIQVGLPNRGLNEPRPYSAKNSSYNRK